MSRPMLQRNRVRPALTCVKNPAATRTLRGGTKRAKAFSRAIVLLARATSADGAAACRSVTRPRWRSPAHRRHVERAQRSNSPHWCSLFGARRERYVRSPMRPQQPGAHRQEPVNNICAGEAGRGFAVVVQEVRALAAQIAKATNEIAS